MSPFQGFLNFIVLTQGSAALHPGLFCNAPPALLSTDSLSIQLLHATCFRGRTDHSEECLSAKALPM